VERLPVHHIGEVPAFDATSWRLAVEGEVDVPGELSWPEFAALPRIELEFDWHGGAGWSALGLRCSGVSLASLASEVRPRESVRFVRFFDAHLYDATVSIESALQSNVVLATHLNGEPLSARHGAPVRLLVPAKYAWKSVKWLRRIEFVADDAPGFWERRGWHAGADPWREERMA
jgi:DMSO/TMAO reductase YedYZ molybdopterin-dependent catalytic subunit